eukprot:Selendium_serpulae@DN9308_c0_g1_i1.p1
MEEEDLDQIVTLLVSRNREIVDVSSHSINLLPKLLDRVKEVLSLLQPSGTITIVSLNGPSGCDIEAFPFALQWAVALSSSRPDFEPCPAGWPQVYQRLKEEGDHHKSMKGLNNQLYVRLELNPRSVGEVESVAPTKSRCGPQCPCTLR